MAKAKPRTRIVAYCSVCEAPAVSRDGAPALLFHAPGCSERPDSQTQDRCQNPDCWAVLDPERVRRYNAKTCDAACRAAAFRARHGIVPVRERAEAQTPVRTAPARPWYDGRICLGCRADVFESGSVHAADCAVFAEQLRLAKLVSAEAATRERRGRYKPPGPQLSYHRAVQAVTDALALDALTDQAPYQTRAWYRERAEAVLRPVLPAAQRARLEAREK